MIEKTNNLAEFFKDPLRAYIYIALFVLTLCLIINFRFDYPLPKIHDEFGYLLSADTFSKGRLTNPTHPQWTFFESFHIIHQPSYQSKFPPGQGMQLAAGIILGHPIHGVWLTLCLWAMALFWMLQGAGIPRHWAFFVSLIGISQYGILSYFGHSYWGGSLLGLAGTLVFGATIHALYNRISIVSIINMGIGVIIMINTRPFEGFIFCIIPMIFFAYKLLKDDNLAKIRKVLLASTIILSVAAGILLHGYYNKQVTGSWMLMPYSVYQNEYMPGYPKFIFEKPGEIKKTRYKELDVFQSFYANINRPITAKGYLFKLTENIGNLLIILFPGLWLTAAVLSLMTSRKTDKVDRYFTWGTFCTMFTVLFLSVSANNAPSLHHFAAWLPVAIFILADGIVQSKKIFASDSKILNNMLIILVVIQLTGLCILTLFSNTGYKTRTHPYFQDFRKEIEYTLKQKTLNDGVKHLIMVKYADGHNIHDEWVYNGADIDSQDVIWARWISLEDNRPLTEYYNDRMKWVLEISGRSAPKLMLYEKLSK